MELIFATSNKGKLVEIRKILEGWSVSSLEDENIDVDVVEDGSTFEENAAKKATEIMQLTGKIVLADDSGLEIDYLNGEPGVHSARYLGHDRPYAEKNAIILDRLKDVPPSERTARFVCVIAAAIPGRDVLLARGTIEGVIGSEIKGGNGFGYDPIFYVPQHGMTTAEMPPDLKNEISHRGKALREMKQLLAEAGIQ